MVCVEKLRKSRQCLLVFKWIGLAIGCLAKFVTGSLFVFNVYEDAVKQTFNYTEKELSFHSSLLNVGLGVGFLPGMFYDRFGAQLSSFMGLIVSVGAYMLLWSTTRNVSFYRERGGLVSFYFFLAGLFYVRSTAKVIYGREKPRRKKKPGLGSIFTYMVALNTNVINFHEKHRGKIVGLLNAFFAGSPSVFSVIYYHIIGKTDPASSESFSNFMLLFAILFGSVDFICMLLLRDYRHNDFENEIHLNSYDITSTNTVQMASATELHKTDNSEESPQGTSDEISISILKIIRNIDFHLFIWAFTFASSVGVIYTISLTQVTGSLHLESHDSDLVLIIPITSAVASAFIGVFSDYFKERFPRLVIVIIGFILFVVVQAILVALADKYAMLATATVFCGVGIGIIWSLSPTIVSELFGVKNFGRNWGLALFLASLVGLGGQSAFGALYDNAIKTPPGSIYCYGMDCVRGGHSVSLGFAVASVILGVVLFIKRKFRNRINYQAFERT